MQLNKENTRIETKGLVMVAMKQEKIGTRNGASTVHDVMSLAMDLTDVRSSVRGRGRYVPTGYVGYDQRVKGLALGKLSIIGSRAGEGHDVPGCVPSTASPPNPCGDRHSVPKHPELRSLLPAVTTLSNKLPY